MPRGKFDSTNQKHYPDLGSYLRRHLAGKPVVASPNDGFSQATNFALGLVWFSNLALHWKFLRLFETICARAFFVCFCENSFLRRAKKTQTRKNRKNDIPCPVEPRYIKGPTDFGFVISRSLSIYVTITGKENRSSFVRGSTVIR